MLGHVENLGILGTKGANPPRSSKDLAKLFEFCTMRIMRRRIADADASSRHPSRTTGHGPGRSTDGIKFGSLEHEMQRPTYDTQQRQTSQIESGLKYARSL